METSFKLKYQKNFKKIEEYLDIFDAIFQQEQKIYYIYSKDHKKWNLLLLTSRTRRNLLTSFCFLQPNTLNSTLLLVHKILTNFPPPSWMSITSQVHIILFSQIVMLLLILVCFQLLTLENTHTSALWIPQIHHHPRRKREIPHQVHALMRVSFLFFIHYLSGPLYYTLSPIVVCLLLLKYSF